MRIPSAFSRPVKWAILSVVALSSGCIAYTAGATAQPEVTGDLMPYSSVTWVPVGDIASPDTTRSGGARGSFLLLGGGWRVGLDEASELAVEVPGYVGLLLGYKRRVVGDASATTWAAALGGAAGIVNLGDHAFFRATLYVSGPERDRLLVPYTGLRVMHVLPIAEGAVSDDPVFGGFLGLRIGEGDVRVSPEIGVYYDESALGLRQGRLIVVPGITVRGVGIGRLFPGLP